MLTLLVSMQQGNVKKFEKLIKIVETVEENPYDNVKSHKKPGFHAFSGKHIFGKIAGWRGGQNSG